MTKSGVYNQVTLLSNVIQTFLYILIESRRLLDLSQWILSLAKNVDELSCGLEPSTDPEPNPRSLCSDNKSLLKATLPST